MAVTVTPLPDDEDEAVETPDSSTSKPDEKPEEKPADTEPATDGKSTDEKPADETPADDEDEDEEEDVPLGEAGVRALNAEREKVRTIRRENTQLRKDLAATKSTVVKAFARAAFAQADLLLPEGKESRAVARALKLLDLDKVAITADGEAEGLAEQIAELREDYPELFARKRTGRRVDAADRGGDPAPKSSAEKLLAQRNG